MWQKIYVKGEDFHQTQDDLEHDVLADGALGGDPAVNQDRVHPLQAPHIQGCEARELPDWQVGHRSQAAVGLGYTTPDLTGCILKRKRHSGASDI